MTKTTNAHSFFSINADKWKKLLRKHKQVRFVLLLLLALVLVTALVAVRRRPQRRPHYHHIPYPPIYDGPPPMPTVQRPPPGSSDTQVHIISVGTGVNAASCAQWVSSVLTGQSVTTTGLGKKNYVHQDKLHLVARAIELKRMRDWDVVLFLDQDTIFTGVDLQPFTDEFVRYSPVHPDDLNVREIRRGAMMPPLRFAGDSGCWAPRVTTSIEMCVLRYRQLEEAMQNVSGTFNFEYLWHANVSMKNGRIMEFYLNSGFYMARVWAFRELFAAQKRLVAEVPHPGVKHDCDQSIFAGLYLDLRWGEIKKGLLSPNAHAAQDRPRVNQFGLHYGLIDIWYLKPPVGTVLLHGVPTVRIDASLYGLNYHTSMFATIVAPRTAARTARGILETVPSPQHYIRNISVQLHNTSSTATTVHIAPPLLALSPRLLDRSPQGDFPPLYPAIIHLADKEKTGRIAMFLPFLGWHIAMTLEEGQRNRTLRVINSAAIEVTNPALDALVSANLGELCHDWINKYIANGKKMYGDVR